MQFVCCRLYYWQPSVGGTVSSQTLFDAFKRIEALHGTKTFRWQVTASQYRPNQRGNKTYHLVISFFSSSRIFAFVLMQKPLEVIMVSDFDEGGIIFQIPLLSCGTGLGFYLQLTQDM